MQTKLHALVHTIEVIDACIGVIGVLFILCGALAVQYFFHEAPCPLCLLQRAAFVGVGISFLMNIRYRNKVSHWALAILCASAGMAVSIRQILLHITTVEGFGRSIWGLHMYSWCFIAFAIVIIGSAFMLLFYPEYHSPKPLQ